MTQPLRFPADPMHPFVDFLTEQKAIHGGASVGAGLPDSWKPGRPAHVGIFDDSGTIRWPIETRPTMRITVWASGRDEAVRIAGRCLGLVLTHRIPGVASVLPSTSIIDDRDPHNSGIMASFTVRTRMRTIAA